MGSALSQPVLAQHKKQLSQLCGPLAIHIGDPFWSNLAQIPVQLSSLDPRDVQRVMEPYCQQLIVNSRKTQNLQTLILRVLGVMSHTDDPEQQRTAANGVCFLKFVMKSLLEKLPGPEFLTFMDGYHPAGPLIHEHRPDPNGPLVRLVVGLMNVVLTGRIAGYAHLLMVETLQCLLVACSSQLYVEYVTWGGGTHPVLEILMEKKETAGGLMQNLIQWYVQRISPPPGAKIFQRAEGSPSVFKFVRKAAVSVLWLPVTAYKYLVGSSNDQSFSPLADTAQLLLLVLVHHVPYKSSTINPYRSALRSLHDVTFVGGIASEQQKEHNLPSVSFSDLYGRVSKSLSDERGTLMLYTLLQCVHAFRDYSLVRTDVETLLLPILKQVYDVNMGSQSQLYLLSIIMLLFSQDTSFSQDVHKNWMAGPEWYKDRPLGKLTLGSFMVLLLLRMAHANLVTSQDLYLHTNTVAALANLTCTAVQLDAFASQRLLSLVELLSRKYKRLLTATVTTGEGKDVEFQLQFYNDFLQMMLEVLNGMVSARPDNNPNLIYAMLQRQSLFDSIAQLSPDYAELVENLQLMLSFFNTEIDEARSDGEPGVWTVQNVLTVLLKAAPVWASSHPGSSPQLRFSYEEEQSAEQFFVPVVWTLVVSFTDIPWNAESIVLFSPETPTASALDSEDMPPEPMTATSNGTEV